MSRKPRVEFEGATYHILCRGNQREAIFKDEQDYERFLALLAEVAERSGWLIHAFVLLDDHYHLLMETRRPNLVEGMRWFQSAYTHHFNNRHNRTGHLFQGRYKALPVDQGEYFRIVAEYIHLNPARASAFDLEAGSLLDYKWSSFPGYVRLADRRSFLTVQRVLDAHGFADDASGRSLYRNHMKRRVSDVLHSPDPRELDEQWRHIRRGWAFGSAKFRKKIAEGFEVTLSGPRCDARTGNVIRTADERTAERLLKQGLKTFGLKESTLSDLKKGDDRKMVIAWNIRKNTSVQIRWIVRRLKMGVASNFSSRFRVIERAKEGRLLELKKIILNN